MLLVGWAALAGCGWRWSALAGWLAVCIVVCECICDEDARRASVGLTAEVVFCILFAGWRLVAEEIELVG